MLRAVDLKFKKEVEKFIRDHPVRDLDTEAHSLLLTSCYPGTLDAASMQQLLRHEDTRKSLHGLVVLYKLLAALRLKSPEFSMPVPIKLVLQRVNNNPAPFVFKLSFTIKHDSAVSPDYLIYEIIYPRINTIFLSVHKHCNVTFGLSEVSFCNTLATLRAVNGGSDDDDGNDGNDGDDGGGPVEYVATRILDNQQEEDTVVSSLALIYLPFPCPEDAAFPLCSIFMGRDYGVVAQSIQDYLAVTSD